MNPHPETAPTVYALQPTKAASAETANPTRWQRIRQAIGRTALVVSAAMGLTAGMAATEQTPAFAESKASCHGDYCTGYYANEVGCDEDARTLIVADVTQTVYSVGVTASRDPGVHISSNGQSVIGKLEVRYSEECGTAWAKLNTRAPSDINFIGIQHDGGYTQKRDIGGRKNGSPAALSYSPMVYGRDKAWRAFVESKTLAIAHQDGTFWTED